MIDWLLDLDIIDGPVVWVVRALALIAFVYLLLKRASIGWALTALAALVVGAGGGLVILWVATVPLNAFGGPLADGVWLWVPLTFAALGLAIVSLWSSRAHRKALAVVSMVVFLLAGALGVNAAYGLQTTIAQVLHISTAAPVDLPRPDNSSSADPAEPLYKTWTPPADMPSAGKVAQLPIIPNTNSGWKARQGEIYLPPAALVKDPPRLPIMVIMMGQPGDPEATSMSKIADEFAAKNKGLAPIVIAVDQLGDPLTDPLCLDTSMGKVETYVMKDVVPWIRTNINGLQGRQYWTFAGYSNGGQCATYFGSKYPETFGNILAISPEEFAGADSAQAVLQATFNGDQKAYDAVKSTTIMAADAPYKDTWAIFTVGSNDPGYQPSVQRLSEAAQKAGMKTTFFVVPGGDHGAAGFTGGATEGLQVLYPRLGLSAQ